MSPAKAKKAVAVKPATHTEAHADRLALRWYAAPGLFCGIIALTWFLSLGLDTLPVAGPESIGRTGIILGTFTGLISFASAYYYRVKQEGITRKWIALRDGITLTFAHSVVLLATLALLTLALDYAFKGLQLDIYTSALLIAAFTGAANYAMIFLGQTIKTGQLIAILAIILIGGVLLAAITNTEPDWWQINFSYLGSVSSSNPAAFNLTLIIGSLVMLALTEYIFTHLSVNQEQNKGLKHLKWLFVGAALGLGGVGLFPYTPGSILATLHNLSAMSMVIFILAMIAGLRWFIPRMQGEFLATSYVIGAALILAYVLFSYTSYLSLTAFELGAFALSFIWLILLLRNLQYWSDTQAVRNKGKG